MAKFRKKSIFIVILALCLALCLTLVACNDGNNKPTDTAKYSVTVKIGDTPQPNVTVELTQGGTTVDEITGEDGKASFELAKGTYEVSFVNLPEHYAVPANTDLTVSTENPDLVVSLEEEFAYVVKLVNPDGSAFEQDNVYVGICTFGGVCHIPVALGEGGVTYLYDTKGEYHVKVTGTGMYNYAYECDSDSYYTGKNFSETETEMTITVYPVQVLDADNGVELTSEEKSAYRIDADAVAYKFTNELNAGESVYYALYADMSAQYAIYVNTQTNRISYYNMDDSFKFNGYQQLYPGEKPYVIGKTYYYFATNNTDEDVLNAEIIVVYPSASYVSTDGVGGNINVTASKQYATIKFSPTQAGYYTFTSNGNALTHIAISNSDYNLAEALKKIDEADYKQGNSASVKVTEDFNGRLSDIYIGIAVNSDEAVSFEVQISQVNRIGNSVTNVLAPANLADAEKPDGDLALANIPMSEDSIIVKGNDGYYHYGDENGAIVYVLITESLDTLESGAALAYFELSENASLPYVYDITTPEALASTTAGNSYKDYRQFIRGFKDYDYTNGMQGPVPVLPSELEQPNCYANHVNEDGAYPLTDELKSFLQDFANYNSSTLYWSLIDYEADSEYYWMFALYYYTEATEADAIVGTYELVSITEGSTVYNAGDAYDGNAYQIDQTLTDGKLTSGSVKLEVSNNGRYVMYLYNPFQQVYEDSEYELGTWTKNGDVYSLTCEYGNTVEYSDGIFTYTDPDDYVFVFQKIAD